MIKFSEILTIMVQAFFITLVINILVNCINDLIKQRKRGKQKLREYTCKKCGFSAWALDHITETKCKICGASVETKPIPKVQQSFINAVSVRSDILKFIEK